MFKDYHFYGGNYSGFLESIFNFNGGTTNLPLHFYIFYFLNGGVLKLGGYPKSSIFFDHSFLLKPTVTWGKNCKAHCKKDQLQLIPAQWRQASSFLSSAGDCVCLYIPRHLGSKNIAGDLGLHCIKKNTMSGMV